MAKSLNFHNVKKSYLTVTLDDEANTTIMIGTPTKAIMDDLIDLQDALEEIKEDGSTASTDATDDLYHACAKVMSRNKGGVKITPEYLADIFDFEDVTIFFNAYMDFVNEVVGSKN